MITRPLLAAKADLNNLRFPLYATPKLDGIRALKINGELVSRSFKEIPNAAVRELFEFLPDGIDGELMLRGTWDFNEVQSVIMKRDSQAYGVYFSAFDYVKNDLGKPYLDRIKDLKKFRRRLAPDLKKLCKGLYPTEIHSNKELLEYENSMLEAGFEGVMLREAEGPYKCGRSTAKQQILIKVKRFHDAEAMVVGFEERMHNENKLEKDEFGLAKRSHKKENLVGTNTLGALVVKMDNGILFRLGTGFNDQERERIWKLQDRFLGKHVTYKYQELSKDGVPRFPVFMNFRENV